MIHSYFSDLQLSLLTISILLIVVSFFLKYKKQDSWSVALLTIAAFFLFSFTALLDPFLNLWDERFHALVAKNMMSDPFKPMLYAQPVLDMAYDYWDKYHIWLHKQPLFLWQIAISFKLFGLSEYSLRLPNVILASLLVPILFRMGSLLLNKNVAFITILLYLSTPYFIDLVAGRQTLEHNDFVFMFYVTASIWAFIEYRFSGNKKWVYAIGVLVGCAILVKWLVGLLVFSGWIILRVQEKKLKIKENFDLIIAVVISLAISMPWQIYTFIRFPKEAISAYKFNGLHFTVPLEGHAGDMWWHLQKFDLIYGALAPFIIIPALAILYRKMEDKKLFISLTSMMIIVYAFFSAAATKMPSFTIILMSIVLIAFAALIEYLWNQFDKYLGEKKLLASILFSIVLLSIFLTRIDLENIQSKYTLWKESNDYSRKLMHNKDIFTNLDLPEKTILLNVKGRHYIEAMFYTDFPAYNFIVNKNQYDKLKDSDWKFAIFKSPGLIIPEFLRDNDQVIVLDYQLKGYK